MESLTPLFLAGILATCVKVTNTENGHQRHRLVAVTKFHHVDTDLGNWFENLEKSGETNWRSLGILWPEING